MEKKTMRFDGMERVAALPPLEEWLGRRLRATFPPVDCATAVGLVAAFERDGVLPRGDAFALLWHLTDDAGPHDAACPARDEGREALLASLRAPWDAGAEQGG